MPRHVVEDWLTEDGQILLQDWRRKRLTYKQIADKIGISERSLYRWIKDYDVIKQALARGCEIVNAEVGEAVRSLSIGYTVTLKRPQKLRRAEFDPQTGKKIREWEEVVMADYQEHVPANVGAQKLWLLNRDGEYWRSDQAAAPADDAGTGVVILPDRTDGSPDQVVPPASEADPPATDGADGGSTDER